MLLIGGFAFIVALVSLVLAVSFGFALLIPHDILRGLPLLFVCILGVSLIVMVIVSIVDERRRKRVLPDE